MLFTDILFLFYFLPLALLILRLCTWGGRFTAISKGCIVLSTLVFYGYENWLWIFIFLFVVGGAYGFGWLIEKNNKPFLRKLLLCGAISYCVLFLSIFKYLNWLASLCPPLFIAKEWFMPWFGKNGSLTLPPGISFYVFEVISYCFDIYRRRIQSPRNPMNFLCFVAMFPRFIAGPIVRYAELERQILGWGAMRVSSGLTLFAVGFSMKSFFADQFAVFVPYAFEVTRPDFCQAWLGVVCYSLQLYFDFWSYSIMATGLGLCLGFEFPDNFRSPYHVTSITHFWRQWHITLSNWLRDYLFIPLGGSRVGKERVKLNLILTMLIAGLWHGPSFTFLAWGLYHGIILAAERCIDERMFTKIPIIIRRIVTLLLVIFGWALFKSTSFEQANQVIQGMTGAHGFINNFNSLLIQKNKLSFTLALIGLGFCIFGEKWLVCNEPIAQKNIKGIKAIGVWFAFVAALLLYASSVQIPFLYFQF